MRNLLSHNPLTEAGQQHDAHQDPRSPHMMDELQTKMNRERRNLEREHQALEHHNEVRILWLFFVVCYNFTVVFRRLIGIYCSSSENL